MSSTSRSLAETSWDVEEVVREVREVVREVREVVRETQQAPGRRHRAAEYTWGQEKDLFISIPGFTWCLTDPV